MRRYSARILNEEKGWPQRGERIVCYTREEVVALTKQRLRHKKKKFWQNIKLLLTNSTPCDIIKTPNERR